MNDKNHRFESDEVLLLCKQKIYCVAKTFRRLCCHCSEFAEDYAFLLYHLPFMLQVVAFPEILLLFQKYLRLLEYFDIL